MELHFDDGAVERALSKISERDVQAIPEGPRQLKFNLEHVTQELAEILLDGENVGIIENNRITENQENAENNRNSAISENRHNSEINADLRNSSILENSTGINE